GAAGQRMARLAGGDGRDPWRARVRLFTDPKPTPVEVTDASGRAIAVVVGAGHASDREAANLAERYPDLPPRLPVVGLLHTQIDAASGAERHDRYAPSTRADYEARRGYAYWALGHVHQAGRAAPGPGRGAASRASRSPTRGTSRAAPRARPDPREASSSRRTRAAPPSRASSASGPCAGRGSRSGSRRATPPRRSSTRSGGA